MKLTIPGTSLYRQFISAARDIIKTNASTGAETGIGSTLYEWVARPAAAVFSGLVEQLESIYNKYSLAYLEGSAATDNPTADLVMKNYFITRNTGTVSTARVAVISRSGSDYIPQNVTMTADGTTIVTSYAYQAYISSPSGEDTDSLKYVKSYRLPSGLYIYSIQAETLQPSETVIPAGAKVTGLDFVGTVTEAYLESAIAGGAVVETDAEMVLRAKSSMASPIGSSSTIDKLLRSSGVPILGTRSFGFGDPEMIRGTNNVLLTSVGGCVDTYVQTNNYVAVKSATITLSRVSGSTYTADLSTALEVSSENSEQKLAFGSALWFYAVSSVAPLVGSALSWSVSYYSKDPRYTTEAVRLSVLQGSVLTVEITGASSGTVDAIVSVQYMPSIGTLQAFLEDSGKKPLGMSILVKAAPMVLLGVSGKVTGVTSSAFSKIYKSFLKARGVGRGAVKLSELSETLSVNAPGAVLVSPTVFTVGYVTATDEVANSYVTDGVVRPVEYTSYGWTARTFCYCTSDNMIKVVGDD